MLREPRAAARRMPHRHIAHLARCRRVERDAARPVGQRAAQSRTGAPRRQRRASSRPARWKKAACQRGRPRAPISRGARPDRVRQRKYRLTISEAPRALAERAVEPPPVAAFALRALPTPPLLQHRGRTPKLSARRAAASRAPCAAASAARRPPPPARPASDAHLRACRTPRPSRRSQRESGTPVGAACARRGGSTAARHNCRCCCGSRESNGWRRPPSVVGEDGKRGRARSAGRLRAGGAARTRPGRGRRRW